MTHKDILSGLCGSEKSRYVELDDCVFAEQVAITDTPLEGLTGSLSVMTHEDRILTEGRIYSAFTAAKHGSELGNDAALSLLLTAGSAIVLALVDAACGGDAELQVSIDSSTSGGDAVTAYNQLIGVSSYSFAIKSGLTITDAGTIRQHWFMPGGSGPLASGGTIRSAMMILIPPTVSVLYTLTNRSGSAQMARLGLTLFETVL